MEKQKSNTSFNGQRETENGQRTAAECNCPLPAIARRCSEVTLDEFIDCLVNGNLRRLVRDGNPSDEELRAAWIELYGEYSELSGNQSHRYMFSLMKSILVLKLRLLCVQGVLKSSKDMSVLKELGYTGDTQRIIAKAKRELVELQGKEKELEKMKKDNSGDSASEGDFTAWIVAVSKYMGYRIDRKTTTVAEFLSANKIMEREIETINKKRKHG
jgi:hypothetical protein